MDLLLEIARCPNVQHCIERNDVNHPCYQVSTYQRQRSLAESKVPEPWSGHLEQAQILFLSSNPSVRPDEDFPHWSWSDEQIADFFMNRYGGGNREWVRDGKRTLLKDGTHASPSRFRIEVTLRAKELLQREPRAGVDYALSEVVHCKSRNEAGVKDSMEECANRYLRRVLERSGAKVIVLLGKVAKKGFLRGLGLSEGERVMGPPYR